MAASKRIIRELQEITQAPPDGIKAWAQDDNVFQWSAIIDGPEGTYYEKAKYSLSVTFNSDYPFKPPKVKFNHKVFHPNVNGSGDICLDILKSTSWSPALNVARILLSIQSLLADPNFDDPLSSDASNLYKKDKNEYAKKVREYINTYNTVKP